MDDTYPFMVDVIEGESAAVTTKQIETDDRAEHNPSFTKSNIWTVGPVDSDELQSIKQQNYILTNRLTQMLDQLTKVQMLHFNRFWWVIIDF